MQPDQHIIINLSGRGDKDIFNVAKAFNDQDFEPFLNEYLRDYSSQMFSETPSEMPSSNGKKSDKEKGIRA